MQFDVKQAVAGALTIGMFIMLVNMIGNGPFNSSTPEETALMAASDVEGAEMLLKERIRQDDTPKELWGKDGPVLKPCWDEHITGREGRTWGYVSVKLSDGPLYHPHQVADAVMVARYLGATLLLPTIKEASKEPNSEFDKIYDVNNFISSLKDVVRVVGRLPEDIRGVEPAIVKVPHKVSLDYIEENLKPIFKQKMLIQIMTVLSTSALKAKDTADDEIQAIRCLVIYNALRLHSQVQKLGERVISRVKESAEGSGGHFIAVDLRVDLLEQKSCVQTEGAKSKKCFNAHDVAHFLKKLGFSSETAIYVTQSRWVSDLDPLKDVFPNIHTKEYSMPFNEEKQIVYSGKTQFEMAVDLYICMHSDVFIPAISGLAYINVAGRRIALGKTQILVPRVVTDAAKLKVSAVLSKFVTRRDHNVYSCFCKS
ncbi:hypothetical protein KP509_06G058400 [Ceratopteris richardii]|uniref:O-fucosyltransferase family protein n=1 Tax=Ceratopteris richardii TaxID=49495 RepID=A0A8T2UKN6_CERRI|nr:hypothetical protein KP509_06G058400 [Ceratopteris richardii]KAH7435299.1 hypothetical protein KP509_06G058400 [Ceratopteris richardii]